jgi:ankyrin repeat protein
MTPLMYALSWGAMMGQKPEVVFALLKAGANVNAKDGNGATALMDATNGTNAEMMITALLKAGAEAKAKDNTGKTALDYAQGNPKLKDTDAYRQLQEASR